MVEWENPIFYINFVGLLLSLLLFLKTRGSSSGAKWVWLTFLVGTSIHFLGDLVSYPEDQDHIFIHAVVGVALLVALLQVRSASSA